MSPSEYNNHLAMEQASELLRTGLYTVSEVARAVGIEDLSYFSRLFKRAFGAPPGKFKNSLYGSHNTSRR
jgi:AraC-like DNA-binding protein